MVLQFPSYSWLGRKKGKNFNIAASPRLCVCRAAAAALLCVLQVVQRATKTLLPHGERYSLALHRLRKSRDFSTDSGMRLGKFPLCDFVVVVAARFPFRSAVGFGFSAKGERVFVCVCVFVGHRCAVCVCVCYAIVFSLRVFAPSPRTGVGGFRFRSIDSFFAPVGRSVVVLCCVFVSSAVLCVVPPSLSCAGGFWCAALECTVAFW